MQLREAALLAATVIEQKAGAYRFCSLQVPEEIKSLEDALKHDCGSPACVIGWVGAFMGCSNDNNDGTWPFDHGICDENSDEIRFVHNVFGLEDDCHFYRRMDDICESLGSSNTMEWRNDAKLCAQVLRLYVDKWLPEEVA